ncbi:MAG: hypothetical protein IT335_12345 [Thermomicrobiales bacterium]|jgi:antitoxin (DNA-binding transcriptional repressor) of toxin-antitoxin stability system|nr:hypothetical protein [Thermomicrobiales bacterium]
MSKVTLRELKENTPAIVRAVEEESAVYNVTLDGGTVAVLEPSQTRIRGASLEEVRQRREALIRLIDEHWTSDLTSTELLAIERHEE